MSNLTVAKAEVYPVLLSHDAERIKGRAKLEGLGNPTSSLHNPLFRSDEEKEFLRDWSYCLNNSKPLIEQHLERRVSLLFMQAVLCYRTHFEFREGHTLHQGFNAHSLTTADLQVRTSFEAAHSATVPCLYAKQEGSSHEFVFLYRSGFYDESNATISAIKAVNDADRVIDEKRTESSLRKKVVNHLRDASHERKSPVDVTKAFMKDLITEIKKALSVEKNPKVIDVLKIYLEKAQLLRSIADLPGTYDRWLDVNLDDPSLPQLTESTEELLELEQVKDLIRKKIESLPTTILQRRHQEQNRSRAPNHFIDQYKLRVLQAFHGAQLQFVESAIGEQLNTLSGRCFYHQRIGETRQLLDAHASDIERLAREVIALVASQSTLFAAGQELQEQKKRGLRPATYKLRYQMIQSDQATQSSIKSFTDNQLRLMKHQVGAIAHVELFFYAYLLNSISDPVMRVKLEKLFNMSLFDLGRKCREVKLNSKAHANLENHSQKISLLACEMNKKNGLEAPELKQKIEDLLLHMESQQSNKHLKELFYKRLFEGCSTRDAKTTLETLLGTPEVKLDQTIAKATKVPKAEDGVRQNLDLIHQVATTAMLQIGSLWLETRTFQQNLFREFRQAHGMSQKKFVEVYKQKHPRDPMSASTVSRLENGLKPIDWDFIEKISKIFGISSSLFNPGHFAA